MPKKHLYLAGRSHPGIWRIVDSLRQERPRDDPAWPDHVYLPLEMAGRAIIQWASETGSTLDRSSLLADAAVLAGLAAWRVTQGIYRFDSTLYQDLIETPVTGQIPADLLTRLPEWCVYIETPGLEVPLMRGGTTPLHGVWCWVDRTIANHIDQLVIMMHVDLNRVAGTPCTFIPLVGTLEDGIETVEQMWRSSLHAGTTGIIPSHRFRQESLRHLPPIISLLLYLCSETADYGGVERPSNPRPKRTRLGWRLFPPDKPRTWDVGVRLGSALRAAYHHAETQHPVGAHARPRPHIRRAHWHTFLAGPAKHGGQPIPADQRKRLVKWLPPIPVNLDGLDDLPATIRPVKPR